MSSNYRLADSRVREPILNPPEEEEEEEDSLKGVGHGEAEIC